MLHFSRSNDVMATVYFTGSESALLENPFYCFIFTSHLTGGVIPVTLTNLSTTKRYNKVVINQAIFLNFVPGFYTYTIYEKESLADMSPSGNIVETGFMKLTDTTPVEPVTFMQDNTAKVYQQTDSE